MSGRLADSGSILFRSSSSSIEESGRDIPLHTLDPSHSLDEDGRANGALDESDSTPLIKATDREVHNNNDGLLGGRDVLIGLQGRRSHYPSNIISNSKYNAVSFLPLCLYEQFKFFFNLYFLLVALSQFIPKLKIGYLSTYIAPLAFVLCITLGKEALDDITRRRRDAAANSTHYETLNRGITSSRNLTVGDVIVLHKDVRIPADCLLLKAEGGEAFIRTDQLDGETDWKLRVACSLTQRLTDDEINGCSAVFHCEPPSKSIHSFHGMASLDGTRVSMSEENTLWANTVMASSNALGLIIYTGVETRQAMNTSKAGTKVGLLEVEVNFLSKFLCGFTLLLSIALVAFHGFDEKTWYIDILRFIILFSTIIPISLRVNLDLAKTKYARDIENDSSVPGTVVRTSTIPEDLGRIEYLLSDKTGTLTRNEMEMKKLHIGTVSYAADALDEIASLLTEETTYRARRGMSQRARDAVWALAICHNVTPVEPDVEGENTLYQAASPDEIAIVKWVAEIGLKLEHRDRRIMRLNHNGKINEIEILHLFPFSSETKRMGIVAKVGDTIWFFQKGADMVMTNIVNKTDWLDEECGNMAREGLRTLVVGRKKIHDYDAFARAYSEASLSIVNREELMQKVVQEHLERDLELLGITGVEDKLQDDVKPSLELLRNAGIKIWMLTGDKVETARCIAISSRLVRKSQTFVTIERASYSEAIVLLRDMPNDACLLIDGASLQALMDSNLAEFINCTVQLSTVVACRCSPTQKAEVALAIRKFTNKRVCCIGDGGNDVGMIQAADVGIGVAGKEGRQASLASDYSIEKFCYITSLLLWHGRNSYRNSAKITLLVIHRGLAIAFAQVVYSVASQFEPIALYQGWLMVGYATIYTMMPLFSIVLDRDVTKSLSMMYPELYLELKGTKKLGLSAFIIWSLVAIFQGSIIMGLTIVLAGLESFKRAVAVSYTVLVFNELITIGMEVTTWRFIMLLVQVITWIIYIGSIPALGDYFDLKYFLAKSLGFYWKSAIILAVSIVPVWSTRALVRCLKPPNYTKLRP